MNYCDLNKILIKYRRDFHIYPELGWTEFRTSSIIASVLEELGFEVKVGKEIIDENEVMGRPDQEVIEKSIKRAVSQGADMKWIKRMNGYTGVLGILEGRKEGKTVLLRFDIDAVNIEESQDKKHIPFNEGFSSRNRGVMHACGHDGHAAIGLTFAHIFSKLNEEFCGRIILLFQPAEEGVRGARAIRLDDFANKVDSFTSGHIGLGLKEGEFAAGTCGFLCTTKLDVEYKGKSAHAGLDPNEGCNVLLAASTAILNLHSIAPHKDGSSRINVGVLNAGESRNSIPSKAYMQIETRGETNDINHYVYERALKVIKSAAEMYDVDYAIRKMGEASHCSCDREMVDIIYKCAQDIDEVKDIKIDYHLGASEDVSLLINKVQSLGGKCSFMVFGTNTKGGHHNEKFDFDENVLLTALKVYTSVVCDIMNYRVTP